MAALATATAGCGGEPGAGPTPPPSCEPAPYAADDPYAAARDPDSPDVTLALDLARGYMGRHPPEQLAWDWGEGVLMLALTDLYRVTGAADVRDYYAAFMDHHIDRGYRALIVSSDRCPPAATALALYRESCQPRYRAVVTDTLDYLYHQALRTDDGGINHLGLTDAFGISLWLDSLFMFGTVLDRWGEYAGDEQALDEMHTQLTLFASHLQQPGGLWTHAYGWSLDAQDPDVFWARGNGWVSAAGYQYLGVRRGSGQHDEVAADILGAQTDAVLPLQDPATGLWWTVINRPGESYTETSASALFVAGLARGYRAGLLGSEVLPAIEAALGGLRARIVTVDGQPVLTGTSGPTGVSDFDGYAAVPQVSDLHFGVGTVVLALVESSGL